MWQRGARVERRDVAARLAAHFGRVFDREIVGTTVEALI